MNIIFMINVTQGIKIFKKCDLIKNKYYLIFFNYDFCDPLNCKNQDMSCKNYIFVAASTEQSTSSSTIATTTTSSTTLAPTFIYRFNRPTMPPFRLPPSINTSKNPSMKSYDFPREEERGKVPSKKTGKQKDNILLHNP